MTWNTNIQEAPRGRNVTVMRNTKTRNGIERVPVNEFEIDPVWLATKCGKVVRSYWIPKTDKNPGRWGGLANGELPIAWQTYVVPVHPFAAATQGEAAAPTGSTSGPTDGGGHVTDGETAQPVSAGEAAASSDILLDDCGSGA